LVSMAPQLGDAIARLCLAFFLKDGWRSVFQVASVFAVALMAPVFLFVQNSPGRERSESEEKHEAAGEEPYATRMKKLLSTPFLWVLCILSGSLYGTRTLFLLYSTTFLATAYCNGAHDVDECMGAPQTLKATATASSAYTLMGCVSVLLVGVLKDKLPKKHRGATLTLFAAPLFLTLIYLQRVGSDISFPVAACLVANIGFCLFGPYKVLGAVFAVDVGGKKLKSTCTAFMGIFDNFFAMVMLLGKGAIGSDWKMIFAVLCVLSAMSLASASYIWIKDLRSTDARETSKEPLLAVE